MTNTFRPFWHTYKRAAFLDPLLVLLIILLALFGCERPSCKVCIERCKPSVVDTCNPSSVHTFCGCDPARKVE